MARFCAECGKQIGDDDKFCPFCGAYVHEGTGSGAQPGAQQGPMPDPGTDSGRSGLGVSFGKTFWGAFVLGACMGFLMGFWGLIFLPFIFVGGNRIGSAAVSALAGGSLGWIVGMALDLLFALSLFGMLS